MCGTSGSIADTKGRIRVTKGTRVSPRRVPFLCDKYKNREECAPASRFLIWVQHFPGLNCPTKPVEIVTYARRKEPIAAEFLKKY
jgi:hypothetical protein